MTRQRRTPNPENRSFPRWLILAGLSVACLNGCQHAAYRPPSAALGTAKEDAPKALTPSQLADVKVAFGRTLEKQGQTPPRRGRGNTMLGRAVPPGRAPDVSPPGEGAEWVP
jgi:hypothetical protein